MKKIIDLSSNLTDKFKGEKIFETKNKNARLIEFILLEGDGISPHLHPFGEDCALILSGHLSYSLNNKETIGAKAGDIVFGWRQVIHGYQNLDVEPVHMIIFASPKETGLEYLSDNHPNVLNLPEEKRITHYNDTNISKTMGFGIFENIIVNGSYCEEIKEDTTNIYVDSKNKKNLIFEDENVSFYTESPTTYLRYEVKS
jgi:quercetin dioxygenase-like cupin family protein